jgi:hypothetical protein
MTKADLLESLTAASAHATQGKVNVEAQKAVIDALKAIGKDPAGAERILQHLEETQTDNLCDMTKILNALDDKPARTA